MLFCQRRCQFFAKNSKMILLELLEVLQNLFSLVAELAARKSSLHPLYGNFLAFVASNI